jgi:hypothetical protein
LIDDIRVRRIENRRAEDPDLPSRSILEHTGGNLDGHRRRILNLHNEANGALTRRSRAGNPRSIRVDDGLPLSDRAARIVFAGHF